MERRRVAWLLSLALMTTGAMSAHALAYRLVEPTHHMDGTMHASTAHGYLGHLWACLAVCVVIALAALVGSAVTRIRRGHPPRVPLWLFALVPPVGFAMQEHLEHVIATGSLPALAGVDPMFAVGLVLQLPFALAAYLAARALLALAEALVACLRASPRPRLASLRDALPRPPLVRPRISALALGHGQRAPPFAAA